VVLTNSDIVLKTASKIEAVHIYPDFTTSAEWQFEPEDFDENFKTGIQVSSLPDKTIYGRDEPFAGWAGLEVSETWSDGTERVLAPSEYTITPSTIDTHDPGAYYITIAQIGATYTTGFEIMVNTTTRVLTNVTMDSPPTKLVYELGQDLDFSGMVLMGHYSDSTSAPITAYTYTGYGKTKRGTQTVTVKVNTWTFPITVEVRVPAAATITVNQYSSGSGNDFYNMALIKGRPLPDGGLPKNLKATVSANGSTVIFTKANGGLQSTDLTGYNPSQTEWQNLTLTLDDNTVNVPVFVMDVDPHLSFDYGYWRHQGNPLGGATLATPEAPQYTVPVNTELVITPVVFSMNTDTPTYS
jgi:hypothetical protein